MDVLRDLWDKWVNPVTFRGAVFIAAGGTILMFPDASTFLIRVVLAGALVVYGILELWTAFRSDAAQWQDYLFPFIWMGAGVFTLFFAQETLTFLTKVFAVIVAVRGVITLYQGIRNRETDTSWLFNTIRGLLYLAVGVVLFFVPEAFIGAVVVGSAVLAVIVGAIIIAYGAEHPDEANLDVNALGGLVKRWFQGRDVGSDMRVDVVDNLFFEEPDAKTKRVGFWTLLILSVVIATLGVLADSTAVVIGAMLVAPLMTPIMGVAAAMVNGWMGRITRSFLTVVGGVIVAIATAWVVATWAPQLVPNDANSQILSRTSPTLIDLMIAMAAGAAGAYATIDKRVSSSITGVAIAVALVPPLGVVGVMMQAGEWDDASGAFLLFLTNLVSIILVASIVFLIGGLAPWSELKENSAKVKTVAVTVLLGVVIIIVPLAFTSEGIIASASRQSTTQQVVDEWIAESPLLRVVRLEIKGSAVDIRISGEGEVPSVADLEDDLEAALGSDVTVTVEYFPSAVIVSDDGEISSTVEE